MKSWKELGLNSSDTFFIIIYLLYKKGILSEEEIMSMRSNSMQYNDSFETTLNLIEKNM